METKLKTRQSIQELQYEYDHDNPKPLEDLMRAWKGIKELPYTDPNSFFKLGGFHGEPFRGPGTKDSAYWGGYCNHGNVLFPTWHRVYMFKLEQALQSIAGCENVMLPYWDETDAFTLSNGVPPALTRETFPLDGIEIQNPLRSYVLPVQIADMVSGDANAYTKQLGYETVRYPLSGLVGTTTAQAATVAHNEKFPDYNTNVGDLNTNVINWLNNSSIITEDPNTQNPQTNIPAGIYQSFKNCLNAPNYTVFSNTTSAQEWNKTITSPNDIVTALETPHNDIHLAVGGFDAPTFDASAIADANGDMGENDTAALDPIFYFHHCNIDRVFWVGNGMRDIFPSA